MLAVEQVWAELDHPVWEEGPSVLQFSAVYVGLFAIESCAKAPTKGWTLCNARSGVVSTGGELCVFTSARSRLSESC